MNRTKKLIGDAFCELLEERPFNRTTVQNIVVSTTLPADVE